METAIKPDLSRTIRFGRELCGDLKLAERREWWLTNGRGGYAAGTVAGSLTRRYHGLLIAPLFAPLGRVLVAAKADATLHIGASSYPLFTNRWTSGAVEPEGYLNTDGFWLCGRMPIWRFGLKGHLLESCVWMDYGRNSTWVAYRLLTKQPVAIASLSIDLMVNFRGHHEVTRHHDIDVRTRQLDVDRLRIELPHNNTLDLRAFGGPIEQKRGWIDRFQLAQERERGLEDGDNHLRVAQIRLNPQQGAWVGLNIATKDDSTSTLEASQSEFLSREQALLSEAQRVLCPQHKMPGWLAQLVLAADSFIFERPLPASERGTSIIAGYPWFGDWGRDTMIALPGLTLATGRSAIAKQILVTFAGFVDRGILPNRFPDDGEQPEFNTVDAALWYVEAWRAYIETTNDVATLSRYFPVLQDIIRHYRVGTRHGIRMDSHDNLISCGEAGTQLTWMDAKLGDWVVTPRRGKPVEINALWYNALRTMAEFTQKIGVSDLDYARLAEAVQASFPRFQRGHPTGLFDVLDGPDGNDASIRPNQLFAVSLRYSPLDPVAQQDVINECAAELFCNLGLRSLSPNHPDYRGHYRGDVKARDGAYHQGTVWAWLLGHFVMAEYRLSGDRTLAARRLASVADHLRDAGLGQVSEIFDGDPPHQARGTPAQAWSVSLVRPMMPFSTWEWWSQPE